MPGKELYTADALSRAPLSASGAPQTEHIEQFVHTVVFALPASTDRFRAVGGNLEMVRPLGEG